MYRVVEKAPELGKMTFNLKFTIAEKEKHHHQSLLERFAGKINPEREKAGYKPYSYSQIASMLCGLTYDEREEFFLACENAKCGFGKYFGWRIKERRENKKKKKLEAVENLFDSQ